ncbi:olfactory receptor 7E178-like [Lepisosteus oculatus]|uniref:olfactory receptor 7E178-like n=1 Tax=Lepisosteus oculatus TaxID=7918 RepID=UPI0035F50EF5
MGQTNVTLHSEFIIMGLPGLQQHNSALFIFFFILLLAIFLGNLLIVVLISQDHRLHTPMYFFLWNLAVLDVLITITVIPKLLVVLSGYNKTISFSGCFAQMYFFISFTAIETFLLAVMAYDRYVAVAARLINKKELRSVVKMKTVESHKKAFSMCSLHMAVVFLCYASGTVVYVGLRVESIPPDGHTFIGPVYYFLTPLVNPIIYILKNENNKAAAHRSPADTKELQQAVAKSDRHPLARCHAVLVLLEVWEKEGEIPAATLEWAL